MAEAAAVQAGDKFETVNVVRNGGRLRCTVVSGPDDDGWCAVAYAHAPAPSPVRAEALLDAGLWRRLAP